MSRPIRVANLQIGPEGLLESLWIFKRQESVPLEENSCFGKWVQWHSIPLRPLLSSHLAWLATLGLVQIPEAKSEGEGYLP